MIQQIKTDCSSTVYDVDGVKVELKIMSGGELLMEVGNRQYSKTFPLSDPKWKELIKRPQVDAKYDWQYDYYYPHQDPDNLQGPTLEDVPGGAETVERYVSNLVDILSLREKRQAAFLHFRGIKSRPFYSHPDDESRVRFVIMTAEKGPSLPQVSVTGVENRYKSPPASKYPQPSPEWGRLTSLLDGLQSEGLMVEELTETQYWDLIKALDDVSHG